MTAPLKTASCPTCGFTILPYESGCWNCKREIERQQSAVILSGRGVSTSTGSISGNAAPDRGNGEATGPKINCHHDWISISAHRSACTVCGLSVQV